MRLLKIMVTRRYARLFFEYTKVFSRSVGEDTDIVAKEMYSFKDRGGGRDIALRPEGTAAIVRAYLEHRFDALPNRSSSIIMARCFAMTTPNSDATASSFSSVWSASGQSSRLPMWRLYVWPGIFLRRSSWTRPLFF